MNPDLLKLLDIATAGTKALPSVGLRERVRAVDLDRWGASEPTLMRMVVAGAIRGGTLPRPMRTRQSLRVLERSPSGIEE